MAESSSHIPQGSSSAVRIDICIFSIVQRDFSNHFLTNIAKIWSDNRDKQNSYSNVRALFSVCLVHQSSRNTDIKQIAQSHFPSGKRKEDFTMLKDWQSFWQLFWRKKKSLRKAFTYCTLYKVLISRGFSLQMEKINPQGNLILL